MEGSSVFKAFTLLRVSDIPNDGMCRHDLLLHIYLALSHVNNTHAFTRGEHIAYKAIIVLLPCYKVIPKKLATE